MRAFLDSGLHANYFYRGIIYHPERGVRRFRLKLARKCLASAISLFSFAAFSLASAQPPPAHKPRPQRSSSTLEGQWSGSRSEEHTSELQSLTNLVCRLLL